MVATTLVQALDESFTAMFAHAALAKADEHLFRRAHRVRYQAHVVTKLFC